MKPITRFASAGIFAFLFTIIFSANSFAAVDYFLRLEGIKGEGTYQAKIDPATGDCIIKDLPAGTYKATLMGSPESFTFHSSDGSNAAGTIEISSFSWGTLNSSSAVSGTGLGSGKASIGSFSVMKSTDKASPKLSNAVAMPASSGGFTQKTCVLSLRKAGKDQQEYMQVTLQNITISGSNENPTESINRTAGATSTHYDVKANVKI